MLDQEQNTSTVYLKRKQMHTRIGGITKRAEGLDRKGNIQPECSAEGII